MPTQPEQLSDQVDGVTSLFTTTFHRRLGQSTVFYEGMRIADSQFSEPNDQQIQLVFTPLVGEDLHIIYETEETLDGRVVGFPYDPSGTPAPAIPDTLQQILDDIEQKNIEQDTRIDTLEQGSAIKEKIVEQFVVTSNGQTVFTLTETPVDPSDVQLSLQGVEFSYGTDYSVAGTTLTWLSPIPLSIGERIIADYFFIP